MGQEEKVLTPQGCQVVVDSLEMRLPAAEVEEGSRVISPEMLVEEGTEEWETASGGGIAGAMGGSGGGPGSSQTKRRVSSPFVRLIHSTCGEDIERTTY